MVGRKRGTIPAALARGRDRFEAWRRTHEVGTRIPEQRWSQAVSLAVVHGLSRTASALRLGKLVGAIHSTFCKNQKVWTTYSPDGQVKTLVASNNDTSNQLTVYTYGTTLTNSAIASSQLLRTVRYPDSDGTGGDVVTYSYNRQGQQTQMIDQRGCTHAYDYDLLGRPTHDRVLDLGAGAVGPVRRLSTIYNTRGMVEKVVQRQMLCADGSVHPMYWL